MNNTALDMVEDIHSDAVKSLNTTRDNFVALLKEEKGTELGAFIERVLEWYGIREKRQLLAELFRETINIMDSTQFLDSFLSFLACAVTDDGEFEIKWLKPAVDKNGRMVWGPHGDAVMAETVESDEWAEPVVVFSSDGTQSLKVLHAAMDRKEINMQRRYELEATKQRLLAQFRQS